MSDFLEQMCADKRRHVEKAKIIKPFEIMHREALRMSPPRVFLRALRQKYEQDGIGVITEIKKASPSAGIIRNPYSPSSLAKSFVDAGAACLSVVTDETYFQGCNGDLLEARNACHIPVLRKDLMIDVWQVAEARAIGADAIILIMSAIDDAQAHAMHQAAIVYGMEVIIEIYNHEELMRALKLSSSLIGINSRNLKTMKVDLRKSADLIRFVPAERFVIGISGIETASDMEYIHRFGARGVLVGESLLKKDDVGIALRKLYEKPATHERSRTASAWS